MTSYAKSDGPGWFLRSAWTRLSPLPGGRWLFSLLVGRLIPYSGSIWPRILELSPGHAVVAINDREKIRNHLGSIHALALANLGELTSGLALSLTIGRDVRGIVLEITTEYLKKARGRITARSQFEPPVVQGDTEFVVKAELTDDSGAVVSRTRVRWRLGPIPGRSSDSADGAISQASGSG